MDHLFARIAILVGSLLFGLYLAFTFPEATGVMRTVGFIGLGLIAVNLLLQARKK